MLSSYRQILALPGAVAFTSAGFVARTGHLITVLSIIFLISARTGGYGLAGAVAAAYAVTHSVASPWLSRLIDRHGQVRTLQATAATGLLARGGFLIAIAAAAPSWSLFVLSAASGATMPSAGSLVRSRWRHLVGRTPLMRTALSFESVIDELIFVTGPLAVAALTTYLFPAAGLALALGLTLTGQVALAAQGRTDPTPRRVARTHGTVLAAPGLGLLVVVFVGLGAVESVVDLAIIAFSTDHGARILSGWILAVLAFASVLSGLWYGRREWSTRPEHHLVISLVAVVGCVGLFAVAYQIWFAYMAAALLGLAVAPAVIAGFAIAAEVVPDDQFTEGMTWLTTALGLGIAAGSVLAGMFTDAWGTQTAFLLGAGCAAVTTTVALAATNRIGRRRRAAAGSRSSSQQTSVSTGPGTSSRP